MTLSDAPRPVIDYARPIEDIDPRCAGIARWMVVLAVLSAACVGSCFLTLASGNDAGVVQVLVFGATLWVALAVGLQLSSLGETPSLQILLDSIAAVGLLMIGLAPVAIAMRIDEEWLALPGGLAYALMAGTTFRHVLMYRVLAGWAGRAGRPSLYRSLLALGYVKLAYEALWLGCCALTLFAVPFNDDGLIIGLALASLFGCGGYGLLWIWMLVAHARLATVLKLASRAG